MLNDTFIMGENCILEQICTKLIKVCKYIYLFENYHDFSLKMIVQKVIMNKIFILLTSRLMLQNYQIYEVSSMFFIQFLSSPISSNVRYCFLPYTNIPEQFKPLQNKRLVFHVRDVT